jgi:hypothetical protein
LVLFDIIFDFAPFYLSLLIPLSNQQNEKPLHEMSGLERRRRRKRG